ncbi:MAG: type I restriction-modification system endonuclease [Archangium gephyra]|uniref:Type I restriction-modification system endonuclease n=1 Tax=Archangium gephyra TaxID=48 RepID=A0A2W5SPR4_9BACT|nr:MAG: type I restriction-modification system endonuclease [Archangium gephyra]
MVGDPTSANFGFLKTHDPQLVLLGALAERYFANDPVTALIKLRQFGELLAQRTAANLGLPVIALEAQKDLVRRLLDARALTPDANEAFTAIRRAGNEATHQNRGTHRDALTCLKLARELAIWFHKVFARQPKFSPGPFVPPVDPDAATKELHAELERLRKHLDEAKLSVETAQAVAAEEARRRLDAEERAKRDAADAALWEQLAAEADAQRLATLKSIAQAAEARPAQETQAFTTQLAEAGGSIHIDEADTRLIIDQQLREALWEADSQTLRYSNGARPVAGRNLAIAEWPTKNGPADYVLFAGLTAVGIVEAKRKARDVSASLDQSQRYARGLELPEENRAEGGPWGEFAVPFLYATNGRPWFKQLTTKSGIWFVDARKTTNLPRALSAWHTPDGLRELLKQDIEAATARLKHESPADLPGLRPYQVGAIRAVEDSIAAGKRHVLVSMATGTGKTRTFIGLIYRLVKSGRFRRVLFLVDRNALGEQAAGAFQSEFVDGTRKFSDIFNIKELKDVTPDPETRLHFATVQAVARRLFDGEGDVPVLHVDDYDCIVVDECHRGYTLDKDLSEAELTFRDQNEYLSVYRRVLDFFDAVKVGLTATPAFHTTEIFGRPVFEYGYRQAVVEGFLVDHEPPITITTKLATEGIHFAAGERVTTLNPEPDFVTLEDEVDFEVESFNRQVITENFNRVVCEELARQLDPSLPGKTLIFCATDEHADLVVKLMLEEFEKRYGVVDANSVKKITGKSDDPGGLLRRYKNEQLPSVVVTVDLLTTGVDVPSISNLVFLRRVRSRILYEQMLGRATRLYPGKESFRIFDAVDLYAALEQFTTMKPVVANPSFTFAQLAEDLAHQQGIPAEHVRDEFLAKLQRRKALFSEGANAERFEAAAGASIHEVLRSLVSGSAVELAKWLAAHQQVTRLLDTTKKKSLGAIVADDDDQLVSVTVGLGPGRQKPEDYLEAFSRYLKENENKVTALKAVMQRPRDLTRAELKKLKLELDQAGFSETQLRAANKATTNADFAASIIGHIRQRALGEPLKPYEQRVNEALQRVLASRKWNDPQAQWLKRIAKAVIENELVDRPLLDEAAAFRNSGGFERIDKVFDGKLTDVVGELQDEIWKTA